MRMNGFRGGSPKQTKAIEIQMQNPQDDAGYQRAEATLNGLRGQMDKANTRLTDAQIMASIPALQMQLINRQKKAPVAAAGANWGALNQFNPELIGSVPQVVPKFAPQFQGNNLWNNNPQPMQNESQRFTALAGLLGQPLDNSAKAAALQAIQGGK